MSDTPRFRINRYAREMKQVSDGDYVLFTDYATLKEQRDRLAEAVKWAGDFAYSGGKRFGDTPLFQAVQSALSATEPELN